MSSTARTLPSWTSDYALLRDRIASFPNQQEVRSVNQDGDDVEILRYWPDASWTAPADAKRLIFLGPSDESTRASLQSQGWQHSATMHLLAGKPEDVEQVVKLTAFIIRSEDIKEVRYIKIFVFDLVCLQYFNKVFLQKIIKSIEAGE